MSRIDAFTGFAGELTARVSHAFRPKRHAAYGLRIPLTRRRVWFSDDPGEAVILAKQFFATQLTAVHTWPDGGQDVYDFGSGLVTNVACQALANDFNWAQNCQTIKLSNYHASGTGTTADAATDIALQTSAGPSPVAGTQSFVSAANVQKYQTVATLNYTTSLAITEWALFTDSTLSATTGTPFTATSATSATVTGTPLTASSSTVQGSQQHIVKAGTTASYGLVLSNTTNVFTFPAWYKTADGTAGITPGSTEAFTILPVMFDHRVISAINVVNGSSIQWTYSVQPSPGT